MHRSDKLLPILWGKGSGKGDEQIGEARVRLNTLRTGGNLGLVAAGFMKWAFIKFLPLLARMEKSCCLLRGSIPAPNISLLIPILCVLYLLVGLSTGSSSTGWFTYLNVLLILETMDKVAPPCCTDPGSCLRKLSTSLDLFLS